MRKIKRLPWEPVVGGFLILVVIVLCVVVTTDQNGKLSAENPSGSRHSYIID